MKNIGLIGRGFVGTAFLEGMKHAFNIYVYDKKHGTSIESQDNSIKILEVNPIAWLAETCPVIFVCLPTPMNLDGSCDTSIIESTVNEIAKHSQDVIVVIKSTVPPGTTERLNSLINCVFNPEFLREASFVEDFKNQTRIILGGEETSVIKDMYQVVFPNAEIIETDSKSAEMVKYVTNCFLATKVSFANEIYEICEKLKVDYNEVIEYATKDERLGKSHWSVPGPMKADDGSERLLRGFAGSCFPKDLNALIVLARQLELDPVVLAAAWKKNEIVRPEKDWLNLKGRAISFD